MTDDSTSAPMIPVSWGELIDKITILEIKVARLESADAQAHAAHELALLMEVAVDALATLEPVAAELREVNRTLWDVENDIRACEATRLFDETFVGLARAVYRHNDTRARLKRAINLQMGSLLVEEKSYTPT